MSHSNPPDSATSKARNAVKRPLYVYDWMTRSPHFITKDEPLRTAHRIMREHSLRHLPVLEHGKLVGIVSQRDLYFFESLASADLDRDCVADAMTQEVYCVPPGGRLADVVHEMSLHKYGCAVVLEAGNVIGVFTTSDALELLAEVLGRREL